MASFFGDNSGNINTRSDIDLIANANMLINAYTHSTIPYTSFQYFVYTSAENQIVATPASEENGEPYTKVDENASFGTVKVFTPRTGNYKFSFKYFKENNQGVARISVKDMTRMNTTDIDIDLYDANKSMASFVSSPIYLTVGNNEVNLKNFGKNELSSGYAISFIGDGISVSAV